MRDGCSCWQCQAGCKTMPGYLEAYDLQRIPHEHLASSEGALVVDAGRIMRIPTIVPQQKHNGECVFFEGGLCTIHVYAPYGCRSFNTCSVDLPVEVERDNHRVLRELLDDHEQDGPYTQVRTTLPPAAPMNLRRQAFESLLKQGRRKRRRKVKS